MSDWCRDMKTGEELRLPHTQQIREMIQTLHSIQDQLRVLSSEISQGNISAQKVEKVSKGRESRETLYCYKITAKRKETNLFILLWRILNI